MYKKCTAEPYSFLVNDATLPSDNLLRFRKSLRGGITQSSHRYAEANNKYMKNHDKSKESSYLIYLDANNLYGRTMSQTLPVEGFKWVKNVSKIDEELIKNYDNDCDIEFILKVDIAYLSLLPEKIKINKCNKFVCTLFDKKSKLSI